MRNTCHSILSGNKDAAATAYIGAWHFLKYVFYIVLIAH